MGNGLSGFFRDVAVRHGIKYALAGMLAFYIAQVLRLDTPSWSVTTVFVLMLAQYVGAVAEKSMLRLIGTVSGGIIGYVLTGSLQQQPVMYLLAIGTVVGVCTIFYGQSRAPYAFLLCGLTTMIVASSGMGDPDNSWSKALARTEEVTVGVIASLLVTAVLWPRYAREEFRTKSNAELVFLHQFFLDCSGVFWGEGQGNNQGGREFAIRVQGLRNLMHFGSMESVYFRDRLPTYAEIIGLLGRIGSAIESLQSCGLADPEYQEKVGASFQRMRRAIANVLEVLSHGLPVERVAALKELDDAHLESEAAMSRMRGDASVFAIPIENALNLGGYRLSFAEIRDHLHRLVVLRESLPENPGEPSKEKEPYTPPPLDPFWYRNGVRSGIAVMAGLLLQNWLNPPGGSMLALSAWVFTVFSRLYPGGEGDRRAFHYVVYTGLGGIVYVVAMLLLTPVMVSYAAFNTLLFATLFLFGFLSQGIPGITFGMQTALLGTVGTVGLNAQDPVSFQSIVGIYFGIVTGLLVSAIIQRLMWPVLPQWEMKDRFVEWMRHCRALLHESPSAVPAWRRARLALLPAEVSAWIGVMNKPDCPPGEQEQLHEFAKAMRRLAGDLAACCGRLDALLPTEFAKEGIQLRTELEKAIDDLMAQLEVAFRPEKTVVTIPDIQPMLAQWRDWVSRVRHRLIVDNASMDLSIGILGFADRLERAVCRAQEAAQSFSRLRLDRYLGDTIL